MSPVISGKDRDREEKEANNKQRRIDVVSTNEARKTVASCTSTSDVGNPARPISNTFTETGGSLQEVHDLRGAASDHLVERPTDENSLCYPWSREGT
ncbi:hypothetical protein KIN20_033917 [Parelaphostrongylus tenuis]|uniref:Uncharacterized protein n=1 Tax=Parelaphostrongylus tenuis TaxID=148309 RepID=A0AAD5WIM8_PARTN|nr:hypothetical protein KIN20_033917 [Parelaphostrongylus tenuis]